MVRQRVRWTVQMLRRAQALRERGLSYAAIGAVLADDLGLPQNMTAAAVRSTLVYHGVVKQRSARAQLGMSRDESHRLQKTEAA